MKARLFSCNGIVMLSLLKHGSPKQFDKHLQMDGAIMQLVFLDHCVIIKITIKSIGS